MTLGKSEESFCPGKVDWGTWQGRCVGTLWAGYPRIQLYPEFWPATMRNILYNSFSPLTVGSSWVIQQRRGKQNRKKTRSTWYTAKLIWDSPCTNQIWRWPTTLYRKAISKQELSYQKLKKLNFQIQTCSLKTEFYPRQETCASMDIQNAFKGKVCRNKELKKNTSVMKGTIALKT